MAAQYGLASSVRLQTARRLTEDYQPIRHMRLTLEILHLFLLSPFFTHAFSNPLTTRTSSQRGGNQNSKMAITASWVHGLYGLIVALSIYPLFISLLTIPAFQKQAVYLNAFKMTWGQDLTVPEEFGFMRRQVTPFWLTTSDGEKLLAWHILPLQLYLKNEAELQHESPGIAEDITKTLGFRLLKQNPNTKLVVYFHGAAGTLGSGYRPSSYHAISAASSEDLHIIAVDYRGFGMSSGKPSESGLLTDATCVVNFALNVLEVPHKRIVLFA